MEIRYSQCTFSINKSDNLGTLIQVQEGSADEMKKMAEEMQATKHLMKKAQLHAEEVQGTFDTHNGEYVRMKVCYSQKI